MVVRVSREKGGIMSNQTGGLLSRQLILLVAGTWGLYEWIGLISACVTYVSFSFYLFWLNVINSAGPDPDAFPREYSNEELQLLELKAINENLNKLLHAREGN